MCRSRAVAVMCGRSASSANQRSSSTFMADDHDASVRRRRCIGRIEPRCRSSRSMAADAPTTGYRSGDPGFRRLAAALFAAGLGTFALLYSTQALLPVLSSDFGVSPGASALSLAVTTAGVGLGLLPAAWLSDAVGRTRVMGLSLVCSSALGLVGALAPTFGVL